MILNLTTDNQFRLSTTASNYRLQYVGDESLIANTLALNFIGSGNTTVTRIRDTITIYSSGSDQHQVVNIDSSYTATTTTDLFIVANTYSAAFTFYLPSSPVDGQSIIVKNTGNGRFNNVTINGNGRNIDSDIVAVINSDYGSISMRFVSSLDQWLISAFVI